MKQLTILFLLIILTLANIGFCAPMDAAILDTISANYLNQMPFQLEYKISQEFSNSDVITEEIGQFYLHNKDVFRVNYPGSQILFDGTWLWSIDKYNKQIVVEPFDPSSSLRLIYNVLNGNMAQYEIEEVEEIEHLDNHLKKIDMKSIDDNNFFKSMVITLDPVKEEIRTVEYVDFQNTSIVIDFLDFYSHTIDESILFKVKNLQKKDFIDLRP